MRIVVITVGNVKLSDMEMLLSVSTRRGNACRERIAQSGEI